MAAGQNLDRQENYGALQELKKRLFFTLGLLAVYRLGVFVSTPGVDVERLRSRFQGAEGSWFGFINMFSGGALENFSIFTLGIAPYISVSLMFMVLSLAIPRLEQLRKEGEFGRRIITRYTRIGTIILALFQGYFVAVGIERGGFALGGGGRWFEVQTALTLAAGSAFIMWLGEQITERGLGNGSSIIIFAGIVARMPLVFAETIYSVQTGAVPAHSVLAALAFGIGTIALIVFVERCVRRIPIQYPRRMVQGRVAQQQTQFMPLKLNPSGVLPPIFASGILTIPSMILGFGTLDQGSSLVNYLRAFLTPGAFQYEILSGLLIFFVSFFCATLYINPEEVADNLKKQGGSIPTVRAGRQTSDFLYSLITRLTVWGAIYLVLICTVPQSVYYSLSLGHFASVFGGTAILIVIGVTMDTASQIETFVLSRNYESALKRTSRVKRGAGSSSHARGKLLRR